MVAYLASTAIKKFERKISGKWVARAKKGISNEDINENIKIIKLWEDSDVLIDGFTEAVKDEITERRTFPCSVSTSSCFISPASDLFSSTS